MSPADNREPAAPADWDPAYERRVIPLLALGFGLVGIDRFIIVPMFPAIMAELKLTYQDLGIITGALAFTWGFAALIMGNLSDRLGRRAVLAGSMVAFSLLVGFSGLVTGVASLVLIRALMGLAEGAYTSPSIIATLEAAHPRRRGLAVGVQQMMSPLLAAGILPIAVGYLLKVVDWRWIFVFTALPGGLLALALWKIVRDAPAAPVRDNPVGHRKGLGASQIRQVLQSRNIPPLMICMMSWLNILFVMSMLLPGYMTEKLGFSVEQMGLVLSGMGFGSVCGCIAVPALSDRVGRKRTMVWTSAIAFAAIVAMAFSPGQPLMLFGWLFVIMFCTFGLITMTVGPMAAESVSPTMMATASGLVIACGEVFGGGAAPVIAGFVAHHAGVQHVFTVAAIGTVIGIGACASLKTAQGRQQTDGETSIQAPLRRSGTLHR